MRRAMLLTLILLAQTEAAPTTTMHAPAVVQPPPRARAWSGKASSELGSELQNCNC